MNRSKPLSLAIKVALGIATVSLPFSGYANEAEDEVMLEEVVATGSHIKGLDLEGATNAVQLDSKDIMESGADSLSALLEGLSVTGGGNGTFTTEGAGPGSEQNPVGSSAVSLRGLGTSSTLTLVNGRRVSVSSFAKGGTESFVDINSIPLAAIERVEILPSGASATYGADAVAGVVNIILKKDYEGLQVSGSIGDSTASSNNQKTNLNLAWGTSTSNTRTMVVADYFKREPLFERDRSVTAVSQDPSADGIYSAFNTEGFDLDDQVEQADCEADTSGNYTYNPNGEYGEACEYNTNSQTQAQGEFESMGVTATFDLDFEGMTWFNEFMYQNTKSQGNRAGASFGGDGLLISENHPGWTDADSAAILANLQAAAPGDTEFLVLGRMPGTRAVEIESDSMRFVTGLKGDFQSWDWESAISVGKSESTQTGIDGLYNKEKLQASLLGELCDDGIISASCATPIWYNVFDGKSNQTAGIEELITADGSRKGESNLYSWDFKASTLDLFTLPAGTVAGAFGAEWRREDVVDTPSEESRATITNDEPILGFSSTGAEYERDQYAVYGELSVPLLENLEAQVAGRYDEYDDFGGDFNGKIGLRYQFNDALTLRANWSESFRAPSMAQAGLTTKLTSYQAACDSSDAYTEELLDGNYCGVDGDYALPFDSSRNIDTELVGNNKLKAETADTYGFGVLIRPTLDIELNIDWWRIEYNNTVVDAEDAYVVATLNGQTDGIVTTDDLVTGTPGVQLYCDPAGFTSITSDDCNASGSDFGPEIADVHFQPFNAGKQTVEGLDLVYTHYLYDGLFGSVTWFFDASYLITFDEELIEGYGKEEKAGEYTYPRLAASSKVRWGYNQWSTSIRANYTGEYKDDLIGSDAAEAAGFDTDVDTRTVPSWTTFDLSVSYDLANDSFVQLNIDNILDEKPNFVYASGSNVDYSNTDIMGRFITLRYNHVF